MSRQRLGRFFSFDLLRSNPQREVADELDFHIEETVRLLRAEGMPEAEAREEANRRFGDRAKYERELEGKLRRRLSTRRLGDWLAGIQQDLTHATRTFRRAPSFTAAVVGTLAVAIGATTVMLSIVNGVLIQPLPFPDPNRLVRVFDTHVERGSLSATSSPATFLDWRDRQTTFAALAAHVSAGSAYTDAIPAEEVAGFRVSAEWFDALGVQPMLGRTFTRAEETDGNDRVVIVSAAFWRRFLGADSTRVGRTITLDGTAHQVVGVMPPGFAYPTEETAIWRPLAFDFDVSTSRGVHYIYVIGRLADGETLATAETDLRGIMTGLREAFPEQLEGWDLRLVSMREWVLGDTAGRLLIFLGAVVLLFLIAAVNVANMMMVHATSRARELAVRAAMGAGRWRLVRQLVVEGLALSLAAAAIGSVLAGLGLEGVIGLAPSNIPRLNEAALSGPVLFVVTALAVVLGTLLGAVPAMLVSRDGLEHSLAGSGRGVTAGPSHHRIRRGFVVAQIALAMVLAIGAGLLVRSFNAMARVDPGYRTEQAWTATIALPGERYPDEADRVAFFGELVNRVSALPGVRSAAAATQLPLEYYGINFSFYREGQDLPPNERPGGDFRVVTPGYFATMGIPVLRGREFEAADRQDTEPVILIDRTLANRYFAGEDPIGQLMHVSYGGESTPRRIIGVVGAVRQRTLDTPAEPGYYLPLAQVTWSAMRIVAQTAVDPLTLTQAVRREVAALDPLIPVRDIRTLEARFDAVVGSPKFSALVLTLAAVIAGFVAVAGIYGVTSYSVAQRGQEIGVRMALGAPAGRVRRGVTREVLRLGLLGVTVGYLAALAGTRLLGDLLFEVSATDGVTFGLAGLLFLLVAWLGGYVPARRASAVDPIIALRAD